MLEDIQKEIVESIQKELHKNQNLEKLQYIIYDLIYNILKPFRYIISLLIFFIVITFILNIINIYLNMIQFRYKQKLVN